MHIARRSLLLRRRICKEMRANVSDLNLATTIEVWMIEEGKRQYAGSNTSSSAIAETTRCRVGQFWPKVEDDVLQTI